MAIGFRSVARAAGVTNGTGTEPAGAAQGDVLVAFLSIFSTLNGGTGPTGWTKDIDLSDADVGRLQTWWIVRGASAPSLVWQSCASGEDIIIAAYTGVDNVTPIDVAGAANDNGSSTTPSSPSLTTVTDNAWMLLYLSDAADTATITKPTGTTQRFNVTANGEALCDVLISTHGATGAKQWTLSPADVTYAASMALRPAATSADPFPLAYPGNRIWQSI